MFKLEVQRDDDSDDESDDEMMTAQKVVMTCVGIGYANISKRTL